MNHPGASYSFVLLFFLTFNLRYQMHRDSNAFFCRRCLKVIKAYDADAVCTTWLPLSFCKIHQSHLQIVILRSSILAVCGCLRFIDCRMPIVYTKDPMTLLCPRHLCVHLCLHSRLPIIPTDTQDSQVPSIREFLRPGIFLPSPHPPQNHESSLRARRWPSAAPPPSGIPTS